MNQKQIKYYMTRALELAKRGKEKVHPNPLVGCVIVRNGKIVGEGYHHEYGAPHAEVNALKEAGKNAKGSTVFVNLEPCAHYGKTPPCSDALIAASVKEVIIAVKDPNPMVKGKGIAKLKNAGVSVTVGVMEEEAKKLNEKFFYAMEHRIPYVAVKIAQTLDGRMNDACRQSKWITSMESRKEAHRLRAMYDAILVGAKTVKEDDPELTVRYVSGRNPMRIILDGKLSVPIQAKVFRTEAARAILFTSTKAMNQQFKKVLTLEKKGVEVYGISNSKEISLKTILRLLWKEGVTLILVEGGAYTASSFLEQNLVQKVYLFGAPLMLGGGGAIAFHTPRPLSKPIRMNFETIERIGEDLFLEASVL